jgi:tetratricopeptide (TPR) repeat protein
MKLQANRGPSGGGGAYVQAHRLASQGRFGEAIALLKRHLQTQKNDTAALGLLAEVYADSGSGAEARKTIKKALRLAPRSPALLCRNGRIFTTAGHIDQAAEQFRAALAIKPNYPWATRCLVGALLSLHRNEEAYALLVETMKEAPEATEYLASMTKVCALVNRHDEGLQACDALLANEGLPDAMRTQALFDKSGFLRMLGEHDQAFAICQEANRTRASTFSASNNRKQTDRMIEAWTRERLAKIVATNRKTDRAVFIVGMPRSGTSLVEQIAASHPRVFGAGEMPLMNQVVSRLNDDSQDPIPYLTDPDKLSAINIETIARHYLQTIKAMAPGADRVTDKMPYNFRALGMISKLFPDAKVIHCRRDPRDTCLSCYMLDFLGSGNDFAFDLADLGSFYADYQRLMEHWKSVLDLPILDVRYEDMIEDQESQSRRLIEFLGLDWDDRCLDFHKTKRRTKTLSEHQVSRPIYQSSVARWKPYEKHLGALLEQLPSAAL